MKKQLTDHGGQPWVLDIEEATLDNDNFRTTIYTGSNLQMTLMSIPVGGEVGLEIHPDNDQFFRVEQGEGKFVAGLTQNDLNVEENFEDDFAIFVPAGTWHNLINTGKEDLKFYTIYAPAHHPKGTVHKTKADSDADEHDH